MTETPANLSARVDRLLARFRPLADNVGFVFRRPRVSSAARPNVLFLGNHSSGKSSFVNFLLDDAEQATGVAPTDDGFTVLLYGDELDAAGPAALDLLPGEFAFLRELGDVFLQHLKVKFRRSEILRKVTLVDSPGMIGGAGGEIRRGYDFFAAVRRISGVADLVLFLFDPEKPGTTGETVHALGSCFRGMEYKLRLLMNKCDTFEGMYDFARAHGALCWNLAHVLPVKDLPQVFTTYIPGRRKEAALIPLEDFDRQREDILSEIAHADQRKADNLLAAAGSDLDELSMLSRVILAARRRASWKAFAGWFWSIVFGTGTAAGVAAALRAKLSPDGAWASLALLPALLGGLAAGAVVLAAAKWAFGFRERRRRQAVEASPDGVFEAVYLDELSHAGRDDLRGTWEKIRDDVRRQLKVRPSGWHFADGFRLRRLDRERALLATLR
jgi:hypothetical protein